MRTIVYLLAWLVSYQLTTAATLHESAIFVGGKDGYHTYRIPSLLVTRKGTLLAFAEGRKNSKSDTGDIDLVLKRSTDGGTTWAPQQIVWDDGGNTCGNPCPVVDERTGTIWLLLTHNLGQDHEKDIKARTAAKSRTVWVSRSDDDGKSWSRPIEITSQVKDAGWGWYATGPGVGIQIKHGPNKGRLVVPSDHSYTNPNRASGNSGAESVEFGSHSFHSDDGGRTWKLGGVIRPKMNECQVVELADGKGTLLMDMRSYLGKSRRAHAFSKDGGQTWTNPVSHPELVEPICQASIIRYSWPTRGQKSRILFSNPANEKKRMNMTVRLSYDEGKTWPVSKSLFSGLSAYSSLAPLPDQTIACLFECGEKTATDTITFKRFSLEWLSEGTDSIRPIKKFNYPTSRR